MNNQRLTGTNYEELLSIFKPEHLEEIKQLKEDIKYFQSMYKGECFDIDRIEASKITLEIIDNLKILYADRIKYYAERYTKTT